MKRLFNFLIFLLVAGILVYLGLKSKLLPNPFGSRSPEPTPTPVLVSRDSLRVAVPNRPEKLLLTSLQRLLQIDNHQLEVVPYDPQTVWLELASGEIDVVIAPVGEAVKAQGRFKAGRFLFFSGLSTGLDHLIVRPEVAAPARVAVQERSATDYLARQMLPEAAVIPAESASQVESWLKGKAVDAAMIDVSLNTEGFAKNYKVLASTSAEDPRPSVFVLSRPFAEQAEQAHYASRREVLEAAIDSWSGLVGYLESQPELLKTTLRKEAEAEGIDLEALLSNYTFLTPSEGREQLLAFQEAEGFRGTLDLLVLSGVTNLSGQDWPQAVDSPAFLQPLWQQQASYPAASPTPVASATPDLLPTASASPDTSFQQSELPPTYSYPQAEIAAVWPKPLQESASTGSLAFAPALSLKQAAVAAEDAVYLYGWGRESVKVPLDAAPTTVPLSDGRSFFIANARSVLATNSEGKTLWQVPLKGKALGLADLTGERLVYAVEESDKSRLICLDPVDGELLWEQPLDSAPASGPTVGSTPSNELLVVVIEQEGQIRAFRLQDGAPRWSEKLAQATFNPPAIGYGRVATTHPNGLVTTLSMSDGKEIWRTELGSALTAPPTVSSNGVLVPSKDTYLYCLADADGTINWKTRLAQTLSQAAVVVEDQVIQTDENGQAHSLKLSDGELVESQRVSDSALSRVVARDGRWAVNDTGGYCRVYGPK